MLGRDGLLALIGAENDMIYGLYVTHDMITLERWFYCVCVSSAKFLKKLLDSILDNDLVLENVAQVDVVDDAVAERVAHI